MSCPKNSKVRNPIVELFVSKIRNPTTGKKDFRQCLEKIGEFVALQISNRFETSIEKVNTLLNEEATHDIIKDYPILITILRAGVPFHTGIQRIFAESESGFIGAMRNEETLLPHLSYIAIPNVQGKTVIVADTMLATGGSFIAAINQIKKNGPAKIIVAAVIASEIGIRNINKYDPEIQVFYACVDPKLNQKGYIVPGLGDAGDRSYGLKI